MPSRRLFAAGLFLLLPLIGACQKDPVEFGIIATTSGFPIAITSLTNPVRVGDNASMVIVSEPDARCETDFDYQASTTPPQSPEKLNSRRSNSTNGEVTAEWRIQLGTVAPQTVTVIVTCTKEGRTGITSSTFEVIA